jgi:hypothetical protein
VINAVPISLFEAIATAGAVSVYEVITSPFLPSSSSTGVAVFGFQVGTPLIKPLEIKVAQEFFPLVTNAVDLDRYRTFQTGLLRAENFVMADSVLFEYETFPP